MCATSGFRSNYDFTVNKMAAIRSLADLLSECQSPTWLVTNEVVMKRLEYLLWESLRQGMSEHLAGSAPCVTFDLDRLLTLTRKALG